LNECKDTHKMRIATTLSSGTPKLLLVEKQVPTAFCWHSFADDAFIATSRLRIFRVNGETGGVFGSSWTLPGTHQETGEDESTEQDTGEFIVGLFCSSRTEPSGVRDRLACLIAVTNKSRICTWDVTDDVAIFLGESSLKFCGEPSTLCVSQGLSFSSMIGLSKTKQCQVMLAVLDPRLVGSKRKFGSSFALEPKFSKQIKRPQPASIGICAGLPVLCVGMTDGSLHVWRFSAHAVLKHDSDDTMEATSYVVSPTLNKSEVGCLGSITWATHNENTKLILVHEKEYAHATLWRWSADFENDADPGSLCRIRDISTLHPNGLVAVHPFFPIALILSKFESETTCTTHLLLIDLETGLRNGEQVQLQRRTLPVVARPPSQSKPKPPPTSPQKSKIKDKMEDKAEAGVKRKKTLFRFTT